MNDKELIEHIDYTTKVINVQDEIQQLRNRVKELEEANKLLEADAGRYRKLLFIYADNPNVALYHKGTLHAPYLYINEYTRKAFDEAFDKAMENKNDNS